MQTNYITLDDPAIPRFWAKVHKTSTCWLWTASTNKCGYGQFNYKGMCHLAPRFAYLIAIGSIPDTLCVLHRCDNPRCVHPDHLFLGTQTDNLRDMIAKGRAFWLTGRQRASPKGRKLSPATPRTTASGSPESTSPTTTSAVISSA